MERARVPEAVTVGPSLVLPGVAPVGRRRHENGGRPRDRRLPSGRLDQHRPAVRRAQPSQREVLRAEVVDAGLQPGELAADQVEIDVVERARVRGRAEVHLPAGVALLLRDARGEEEDPRQGGEIGSLRGLLVGACLLLGDPRERLQRRDLERGVFGGQRKRLERRIDLEGERLILEVQVVGVPMQALLGVLGGVVIRAGGGTGPLGHDPSDGKPATSSRS